VTIFGDGRGEAGGRGAAERLGALKEAPAEVEARLAGAHDIDLFPRTLTDIADEQAPVGRERRAERIAQADCEDPCVAAAGDVRIAGGRDIASAALRKPQNLSEADIGVLRIVSGIAAAAAVADTGI
jgi:hypothetical protein